MFLAQVANTIAKSRLQIFGAVEPDAGLAWDMQRPNSEHKKIKQLRLPIIMTEEGL